MTNVLARVLRIAILGALFLHALSTILIAQQVFPLAVGNSWHYAIYHYNENPFRVSQYTIRVVRDTVMPNGKLYYVLDSADMFGKQFLRADSSYLYYWDHSGPNNTWAEHKTFNLRAAPGEVDTINLSNYPTCVIGTPSTYAVFGKASTVRSISLDGRLVFDGLTLADGFGYIAFEYSADWGDVQYAWHLQGCIISDTVYGVMTAVQSPTPTPARAELHQNYPNPFNPATIISYDLTSRAHVTLSVYNLLGQQVATLVHATEDAGYHEVRFDGTGLAGGVYFCRLQAGDYNRTMKLLLVR